MGERPSKEKATLQTQLEGNPYEASSLIGLAVAARDGDIGKVRDLYFDDEKWVVRYLVLDTGGWLTGRTVLVSPHAVRRIAVGERLEVDLDREQVKNSPSYDSDKPVSRQYEVSYYGYYGYPHYWVGPYAWGLLPYPSPAIEPPARTAAALEVEARRAQEQEHADPHLRSMKTVVGCGVDASDGSLGHVETFLVDAHSWDIIGMVIDTKNWLPGKHVIVSPAAVADIASSGDRVSVAKSRETLKSLPEYHR